MYVTWLFSPSSLTMQSPQIHEDKIFLLKYSVFISFIPITCMTTTKGKEKRNSLEEYLTVLLMT